MLRMPPPEPRRRRSAEKPRHSALRRLALELCPTPRGHRLSPGLWLFGVLGLSALGMAFADGDVNLLLAGPLLMLMGITCQCYSSIGDRES
jgi:hypothetical protein